MPESWVDRLDRAHTAGRKALRDAAILPEADATDLMRDALRAVLLVIEQIPTSSPSSSSPECGDSTGA